MQLKSDWLDGAKDIRRYDFMAAAVRLETWRILLPGYDCQMWYLGECISLESRIFQETHSFFYPFLDAVEL